MADIMAGIEIGKNHIETQKAWMEMEQEQIAEMVQLDLLERGYTCHIEPDGTYRVMGMKLTKLKIVPDTELNEKQQKEFDTLKTKLAKEYGKMRKSALKEEKKKLKTKAKK